jgi:hypothetical protein
MTFKRWLGVGAAVVGVLFVTDFVIHGVFMKNAYEATASVWRPMAEMQTMMWIMWVLYLIDAAILPYLYLKGFEPQKGRVGQGLRFGALIGLLMATGMSLGTYFMVPIPASMAVSWFVAGMVQYLLTGILIALIVPPR